MQEFSGYDLANSKYSALTKELYLIGKHKRTEAAIYKLKFIYRFSSSFP